MVPTPDDLNLNGLFNPGIPLYKNKQTQILNKILRNLNIQLVETRICEIPMVVLSLKVSKQRLEITGCEAQLLGSLHLHLNFND